jgi:hypothetical protein
VLDSRKEGNQRLAKLVEQGILVKNRIITVGEITGASLSTGTLDRFELLFKRINSTLGMK